MAEASWYYKLLGEEVGPISQTELVDAVRDGKIVGDTRVRKGKSGNWVQAFDVRGLFIVAEDQQNEELDNSDWAAEVVKEMEANYSERQLRRSKESSRKRNLKVSTCAPSPNCEYEILDTIFALDSDGKSGFFFGHDGNASIAFNRLKEQLIERAYELGADAVINAQFEYRVAVDGSGSMFDPSAQVVEIFGYGTAIRYISHADQ